MATRHGIEFALDLSRMPALARTAASRPLPAGVFEIIQIAAGEGPACAEAEQRTGENRRVLIEAARFYLQQVLFAPTASAHRVLGVTPDCPRTVARDHMRLLLQWLHPDHNSGLEAVYAERVVAAWRDLNSSAPAPMRPSGKRARSGAARRRRVPAVRIPWVAGQAESPSKPSRARVLIGFIAGAIIVILVAWGLTYFYAGPFTAMAL